jgi:hypothetical protein
MNLTSLNITYNGEIDLFTLNNLTALTFCAKLSPLRLPRKLRRLEIGDPADMSLSKWNIYDIRRLTKLTYLKSDMLFVQGFEHLPLIEMDVSGSIGTDLEKIVSLTKLTLRDSGGEYIRLTTSLLELALINDGSGHEIGYEMKFNYMTTLTSVTVIDSNVDISEIKLRNLCVCMCRRYNYCDVSNIQRVTCLRGLEFDIPMEK